MLFFFFFTNTAYVVVKLFYLFFDKMLLLSLFTWFIEYMILRAKSITGCCSKQNIKVLYMALINSGLILMIV
jgi:hypothetical protein